MSLGAAQSPNECHRLRNSEIVRAYAAGARLRGSGGVFDLRCGARPYSRICLSRVARRRRQRCDGVRDRQPLLRASRPIAAADHRGQAQLQYGSGQICDRGCGLLGQPLGVFFNRSCGNVVVISAMLTRVTPTHRAGKGTHVAGARPGKLTPLPKRAPAAP